MPQKAKKLTAKFAPIKRSLLVHLSFIVVLVAVLVVGLWAYYNSHLIFVPRDEQTYQTDLSQANSPTFNPKTIQRIEALHDSGVQNPGTDYLHNRINPFAE
jgi:hypothetical protein